MLMDLQKNLFISAIIKNIKRYSQSIFLSIRNSMLDNDTKTTSARHIQIRNYLESHRISQKFTESHRISHIPITFASHDCRTLL